MDNGYYRVAGTPTDCVHLALAGMLDDEPDMVVSGINNSANLGDDVIYSGTVSAAMEGRFLGLPAIAVSLVSKDHNGVHYDSAAKAVLLLMQRLLVDPLPADTILNVNVPDRPWAEIARLRGDPAGASAIARRRASRRPIRADGRSGGSARPATVDDAGPGTDFNAVRRGYHFGHADPCRPDPLPGAGKGQQLGAGAERRHGRGQPGQRRGGLSDERAIHCRRPN